MNKRGAPPTDRRGRIRFLALLLLSLFGVAIARAVHLQVYQADWLREKSKSQYARNLKLLPARGKIFDRNGAELAVSIPGSSAFATSARALEDREKFTRLCRALSLPLKETEEKLKGRGIASTTLKRGLTPDEEEAVRNLESPFIGVAPEPVRFYPKRELASQVLGFVGVDGEGLSGLEHKFDEMLRGTPIVVPAEKDARRGRFLIADAPDAADARGKSLVLTLDQSIQHIVEEELAAAVEKSGSKGGYAVMMDPSTGEVLALAQMPRFNPNDFRTARPENRKMQAVLDVYEPGSTMKALFLALLLDAGAARPTDTVHCEYGRWKVYGHEINDHSGHGVMDLADVLMVSSNIGVAKLSQRLKNEAFYEGLRRFGFGERTGIELEGETKGLLPPPSRWSKITPMTMAFGHGVSVTALQITSAMSALANGGVRMRPFLVRQVLDKNGQPLETTEPRVAGRVVSAQTASTLMGWMERVVHDKRGTATVADGSGYTVAGKTGTAWKPDLVRGGYSKNLVVASFVGVAPARDPRIVLLVAVDEPTKGSRYGGSIAGPAFREICRRTLNYLNVPPDRPVEMVAEKKKDEEAEKRKKEKGKGKDKGKGKAKEEEVAALAEGEPPLDPNAPPAPPAIRMPDLAGLTMREALRRLEKTGVSMQLDLAGSGFAARQSPLAGTPLADGVTCRVEFSSQPPVVEEMN